ILKQVDHLHRAGFWWTPRLMGRPTALLLSRARHAGVGTSLDMSTDPFGWTRERLRAARMALPFVDTFFGNEVEVSALGGDRSPSVPRLAIQRVLGRFSLSPIPLSRPR